MLGHSVVSITELETRVPRTPCSNGPEWQLDSWGIQEVAEVKERV